MTPITCNFFDMKQSAGGGSHPICPEPHLQRRAPVEIVHSMIFMRRDIRRSFGTHSILHCESVQKTYHSMSYIGLMAYSCITLAYVDRFSQFCHCWISSEICNKIFVIFPTTPYMCWYTALRNLNCHFYHFTLNCYKN